MHSYVMLRYNMFIPSALVVIRCISRFGGPNRTVLITNFVENVTKVTKVYSVEVRFNGLPN